MIIPVVSREPESWIRIPQELFPNIIPRYWISTFGRIYNEETNTILPQNKMYDKDKYITISLSTIGGGHQYFQIHRLMMMIFNPIPNCELYDVNHKDGVKYHNWLWNLEWVTRSENIQHALNNNLFNLGETRDNSKLTNNQVRLICEKIAEGKSPKQISIEMDLKDCNIDKIVMNIINGLSWKHISCNYDFSNAYKRSFLFEEDQIHSICRYLELHGRDTSSKEILDYLGIIPDSYNTFRKYTTALSAIRKKKNYKNICNQYNY